MNSLVKVFSNFKEFYNEINGATLTGAIDVIVVEQPNGEFQCSPFHVRFGKLGVLRSREKIVDIEINGEPVDIHMKLGESGEAFFVEECTEGDDGELPDNLATSPIPGNLFPEKFASGSSLNETNLYSAVGDPKMQHQGDGATQSSIEGGNINDVNIPLPLPLPRRNSIDLSTEMAKEADATDKFENQMSDYSMRRHTDNTLERRNLSEKVKEYTTHKIRQKWAEHEEIFQLDCLERDQGNNNSQRATEEQQLPPPEAPDHQEQTNNPIIVTETITSKEEEEGVKDVTEKRDSNVHGLSPFVAPQIVQDSSNLLNSNPNNSMASGNACQKEESKSKKRRRRKSQLKKKNSLRKSSTSSSVSSGTPLDGMNEDKNSEDGNLGDNISVEVGAASTVGVAITATAATTTKLTTTSSLCSFHNVTHSNNSSNDESSQKTRDGRNSAPLVTANTGDESLESIVTGQTSPTNGRIPNLDIHFFSDTEISSTGPNGHSASSRGVGGAGRPTTPVQSDSELELSMRGKESEEQLIRSSASWRWGELPTPEPKEHTHDGKTSPAQAQRNSMLSNMFNFMKKNNKIRQQNNDGGGIYLSDLDAASMDPEMMAMYFPKTSDSKDGSSSSTAVTAKGKRFSGNVVAASGSSIAEDDRESGNGTSIPHSPNSLDGQKSLDSDYEDGSGKLEESKCLDLVVMSLCGLKENNDPTREEFEQQIITYKDICENPSIFSSPNLVVRLNDKYYSWTTACPIVMSILAFQKALPNETIEQLKMNNKHVSIEKVPREIDASSTVPNVPSNTSKRSWWYWRRSYVSANETGGVDLKMAQSSEKNDDKALTTEEMMATVEDTLDATATATGHDRTPDVSEMTFSKSDSMMNNENTSAAFVENLEDLSQASIPKGDEMGGVGSSSSPSDATHKPKTRKEKYRKTLRLSSDAIKRLNLKEGMNEVEFSVTTAYQGTTRCKCYLFHWKYNDKVVISDIDGTITKSDVLGHILPMMGKDWAQLGVAQLFSKIEQNGYKLLYLSARAIGQSKVTREYLRSIRQGDVKLPDGPLLLNPTSLISAFHSEVIERKPEQFKIACLTDIRELFPSKDPFYAGYGNRINDVWAYRAVGIPIKRIFTINTKGELKHELTQTFQSSYCGMTYIVDQLFPPVKPDEMAAIEYSTFNFWRDPLPELDLLENQSLGNPTTATVNNSGGIPLTAAGANINNLSTEQLITLIAAQAASGNLKSEITSTGAIVPHTATNAPPHVAAASSLPVDEPNSNAPSNNSALESAASASSVGTTSLKSALVTIPEH